MIKPPERAYNHRKRDGMTIFDSTSGWDSTEWLREKSLAALETAVRLVDLANEPDTTPWYRKNLKHIAEHLIARLVPMTALFHGVGQAGVTPEEWKGIVERGTFALTKWCRKWKVANPYHFSVELEAKEREQDEIDEKNQVTQAEIEKNGNDRALKLGIYSHMALKMLHRDLTEPAKRLLSWALFHLYTSEYSDIVVLSKIFLPTDIGCTPEETLDGYRLLYEKGLIEKVDLADIIDEAIAIRLVEEGINDSKHALPYQAEVFGRKGLRIQGKNTTGNIFRFDFDKGLTKYLEWLKRSEDKLEQFREYLQQAIGTDNAYIEDVRVLLGPDRTNNTAALEIEIRYPLEADDRIIEGVLQSYSKKWLEETRGVASY